MAGLHARGTVALLGGLLLLGCAREASTEVATPDDAAPVAVVAWLQGQVTIVRGNGSQQAAALDADLWRSDRLELARGAAVVLGLFNNRVVKLDQSLRVQDIVALQLPPDPRDIAEQLAELLDSTTLSARDDLQGQNSRIAGWHVRRNAASTVTAVASRPKIEDETRGKDESSPKREVAAAPSPQPEPASVAAAAEGEAMPSAAGGARNEQAAVRAETDKVGQVLAKRDEAQAPASTLQAPAPPAPIDAPTVAQALPSPATDGDKGNLKAAEAEPREPAAEAEPSGKAQPAETSKAPPGPGRRLRQEPSTRQPAQAPRKPRAVLRAVEGAELIGSEGELTLDVQRSLLMALRSEPVLACLKAAGGKAGEMVAVELRLRQGAVEAFAALDGGKAVPCAALQKQVGKRLGKLEDDTQRKPTGTVRARILLP